MSCEGVWSVKMQGPYGWERIGTAFMKNGKYWGASADYHSIGKYKEDGSKVKISATLTQHGAVRTIFGRKTGNTLKITTNGKIKKHVISGRAKAKGFTDFDVAVRFEKLASF